MGCCILGQCHVRWEQTLPPCVCGTGPCPTPSEEEASNKIPSLAGPHVVCGWWAHPLGVEGMPGLFMFADTNAIKSPSNASISHEQEEGRMLTAPPMK